MACGPEGKCACEFCRCLQIPPPGCCPGEDVGFHSISPGKSTAKMHVRVAEGKTLACVRASNSCSSSFGECGMPTGLGVGAGRPGKREWCCHFPPLTPRPRVSSWLLPTLSGDNRMAVPLSTGNRPSLWIGISARIHTRVSKVQSSWVLQGFV